MVPKVNDRDGDERGGSEWEPIKILFQRELGLCSEITSKCPPHVLSRSRSNHCATDLKNNTGTQALETSSGTNNSGPKTSTGQTSLRPGHPSNTLRVTRVLTETNRVTRTPTLGDPPNSCDFSQKPLHQSDQTSQNLSRTCPAGLDGNPRLWNK